MPQIARPWSWQSLAPGGILGRTTTAISGAMPSSRLGAGSINGLIKKSAVKDEGWRFTFVFWFQSQFLMGGFLKIRFLLILKGSYGGKFDGISWDVDRWTYFGNHIDATNHRSWFWIKIPTKWEDIIWYPNIQPYSKKCIQPIQRLWCSSACSANQKQIQTELFQVGGNLGILRSGGVA